MNIPANLSMELTYWIYVILGLVALGYLCWKIISNE